MSLLIFIIPLIVVLTALWVMVCWFLWSCYQHEKERRELDRGRYRLYRDGTAQNYRGRFKPFQGYGGGLVAKWRKKP